MSPEQDSDVIRMSDAVAFFQEGWRQIVICVLVAGLMGLAYLWLDKPKYKATVALQVGKFANVDVEAPSVVLEKVLVPSYYAPSTLGACGVDSPSDGLESMAKIINPVLGKTSSFITLSVKRPSILEAKSCLEAVLADIRTNQNYQTQSMLKLKQSQAATLGRRLEMAEQILQVFLNNAKQCNVPSERISCAVLLPSMVSAKQAEVSELRVQITDLESALTEPQTRPANFATPINAPNAPVGPSKATIVALAMVLGAALAIVYLMLRRALVGSANTATHGSTAPIA